MVKRLLRLILKLFILLLIIVIPIAIVGYLILARPVNRQYYISQFVWNYPSEDNFEIWADSTSNNQFKLYLKKNLGDLYFEPKSNSNEDLYTWSKLIILNAKKNNIDLNISAVGFDNEYYKQDIRFDITNKETELLPEGLEIIKPGSFGSRIYEYKYINYKDTKVSEKRFIDGRLSKYTEPVNQIVVNGKGSDSKLNESILNLLKSSSDATEESYNQYFLTTEAAERPLYNNVSIISQNIQQNKSIVLEKDGDFDVGDLFIQFPECQSVRRVDLFYEYYSDSLKFESKDVVFGLDCIRFAKEIESAPCSDCRFYTVDKKHKLPASYEPSVVLASEVPGGALIHKNAYADFIDMYNAARSAGAYMHITSSYRSYYTQQNTYESWVQTELAKGYSRAQAEINANTYSALPGHSEHQLGTTLDIHSTGNVNAVWNWLKANAHNYGFVLSYPEGKEYLTGYIYEPWHYRWIGKDLAKEYKQVEQYTYLAQFLRDKKLYEGM